MGKRGPKPLDMKKVVFYRRVTPEQKQLLVEWMKRVKLPNASLEEAERIANAVTVHSKVNGGELVEPISKLGDEGDVRTDAKQLRLLLDDVEKLTNQVEDLKGRLERCARATEDEKGRYWMNRALKAEKRAAELESLQ